MIHNNTEAPFTTAAKLRNQDPLVRAELEARILAKQPHDQIALDMSLPIEAVTAFVLNYFDIRHLLENPTWVRHYILGGESDHVVDPGDVTKFWHHVAYFYGITFLKPFLCQVTRSTLRREGLIAYLRPSNPLPMRLKCFVARACCPYLRGKRRMTTACDEAARRDWLDCLNWVPTTDPSRVVLVRFYALLHSNYRKRERRIEEKLKKFERQQFEDMRKGVIDWE